MRKSERPEEGPPCPRCTTTNRESRSFCRKCGLHLKAPKRAERKPLPTTTRRYGVNNLKPGRPPKATSERRLSERDGRAAVVAAVRARDKTCQAGAVHALAGVPCEGPLDVHEIIPRSAWPKGYLVATNTVLCCRSAHRWIDNHPHGAHALQLHGWSWERPDYVPL